MTTVDTSNIKHHKEIVHAENERRRLAREEAERLAFEKAEKRRLKLEMKLRRRENRRLHNLEKLFTEVYASTADIEKDIINLSNVDGSDNNGMKSVGLRGGVLGELYLLLQKARKQPLFSSVGPDWPQLEPFVHTFWQSFVGEGWTVFLGVDGEFEKNISPIIEGVNLERLDTEFLRSLEKEDQESLKEYLKIHFKNAYFDSMYPRLAEKRAKRMAKVKYEEPVADDGADKKDDKSDDKSLDKHINKSLAEINTEEPEEPETDPNYLELETYFKKMFDMIFDEKAPVVNVRFVKFMQKEIEEKKEPADGDDGQEIAPTPRVLALFIPVPPPAEDSQIENSPAANNPQSNAQIPPATSTGDDDGGDDNGEKQPEVIELLPFVPEDTDFTGEFEAQVSNVDFGKKDLDISYLHAPLLKLMAVKFFQSLASFIDIDESVTITDLANQAVLESLSEIRELAAVDKRDLLYINSY